MMKIIQKTTMMMMIRNECFEVCPGIDFPGESIRLIHQNAMNSIDTETANEKKKIFTIIIIIISLCHWSNFVLRISHRYFFFFDWIFLFSFHQDSSNHIHHLHIAIIYYRHLFDFMLVIDANATRFELVIEDFFPLHFLDDRKWVK